MRITISSGLGPKESPRSVASRVKEAAGIRMTPTLSHHKRIEGVKLD